jgi:hypothetical protein
MKQRDSSISAGLRGRCSLCASTRRRLDSHPAPPARRRQHGGQREEGAQVGFEPERGAQVVRQPGAGGQHGGLHQRVEHLRRLVPASNSAWRLQACSQRTHCRLRAGAPVLRRRLRLHGRCTLARQAARARRSATRCKAQRARLCLGVQRAPERARRQRVRAAGRGRASASARFARAARQQQTTRRGRRAGAHVRTLASTRR